MVFSQGKRAKHEIGLGMFDPIKIPGQSYYFNDTWIFENFGGDEDHPQKRNYTRLGLVLSYNYALKNKRFLHLDFGFAYRNLVEEISYSNKNPFSGPDAVVEGAAKFQYRQFNYNVGIYFGKFVEMGKCKLSFGFGPSFLRQGKGKQTVHSYESQTMYPNMPMDSVASKTFSILGGGNNVGLGTNLNFQYSMNSKISLGLDLTWHLFYSIYKETTKHSVENYSRYTFDGMNGPETYITQDNSEVESFTEFTQLSISNIIPAIKFIYILR